LARLATAFNFARDLAPDDLALGVVYLGEAGGAAQSLLVRAIAKRPYHSADNSLHRKVVHLVHLA